MASSTESFIERLQQWASCDVCVHPHCSIELAQLNLGRIQFSDGLSKLGHAHGGFLEGLVMYSPEFQAGKTKIVGPVFTVKFAPKADVMAPKLKGNYVCSTTLPCPFPPVIPRSLAPNSPCFARV